MPNWCECTLTLSRDEAHLRAFHAENYVDSPPDDNFFAFEVAYPDYDKHEHRMIELTCREDHDSGSGALKGMTYEFLFAWGPPKDWITRAAAHYPDITFDIRYEEVGMCFKGTFVVKGNEVLKDVVHDTSGWTPEMYAPSQAFLAQDGAATLKCDDDVVCGALQKLTKSVVGVKLGLLDAAAAANKAPEAGAQ